MKLYTSSYVSAVSIKIIGISIANIYILMKAQWSLTINSY